MSISNFLPAHLLARLSLRPRGHAGAGRQNIRMMLLVTPAKPAPGGEQGAGAQADLDPGLRGCQEIHDCLDRRCAPFETAASRPPQSVSTNRAFPGSEPQSSPSPRLRGEGRGEGPLDGCTKPHQHEGAVAPHPESARRRADSDLSPQAGRGGWARCQFFQKLSG
jgi:hypothetical protein